MIIQSANDACIALAEGLAGNEDEFAELMTKRARELGLQQIDLHQFDRAARPAQLMTVRELAKLAQHIIQTYPELLQVSTASASSPGTRSASRTAIRCWRWASAPTG